MKSFVFASLLTTLTFLSACSNNNSGNTIPQSPSPDVFHVSQESLSEQDSQWVPATDCRANIAKVLCEVEGNDEYNNPLDRKCLGGEEQYQKSFEEIYDALDPISQGAFCSLRRIFIERTFFATAYAAQIYYTDNGQYKHLPGAIIGARKSLLSLRPQYSPWASWKEQQNFARLGELEAPLPIRPMPQQQKFHCLSMQSFMRSDIFWILQII